MERSVRRELLDVLPPACRDARQSRNDLVRVNSWMANPTLAGRELLQICPPGRNLRIADLGGGDGRLLLKVARLLAGEGRTGHAAIVDWQNILSANSVDVASKFGWNFLSIPADASEWANRREPSYHVVLANLFLHHFTSAQLQALFASLRSKTRALVAIEPRRTAFALALSRLLWLIGCNHVTRHDGRLSVRAGFRGNELSDIWGDRPGWQIREQPGGLCSHVFVARKA